jgi:hypothetical protein
MGWSFMFPSARPDFSASLMRCAKKAPLAAIGEQGQEGASHADEGGNICCIRIRQENTIFENIVCRIAPAG